MLKKIFCTTLLGSVFLLTSSSILPPNDEKVFANANNLFAFDLYKNLSDESEDNLFISPYSVSTTLAMTALGSKGTTWTSFQDILHWNFDQSHLASGLSSLNKSILESADYTLTSANGLWLEEDFRILDSFKDRITSEGLGEVASLNFKTAPAQSVLEINEWVSKRTGGNINDLLSSSDVSSSTALVLTNALYLKAAWSHLFNKTDTAPASFFINPQTTVQVETMHKTAHFPIYGTETFTLLEMPYGKEDTLSCYIVLPSQIDGLATLESSLNNELITQWISKLTTKNVRLSMPKLDFSTRYELNEPLQEMGLTAPFSSAEADLSGIDGNQDLVISTVVHSGFLKMDEDGTEAAAATAAVINFKAFIEETWDLEVNRPFLFFIRHKPTSTLLFMGRIVNP